MRLVALASVLVLHGCGSDAHTVGSRTIGPRGGLVSVSGVTVEVPPGALDREVLLTIYRTGMAAPDGFRAATPLYRFEPEGLRFALPATVRFDLTESTDGLSVVWTDEAGEFGLLPSVASRREVRANIDHFSLGFAGAPVADDAGVAPDDADQPDTSTPDTGSFDADTPDAGGPDTGSFDAGTPDAAIPDAGSFDTGAPDTGAFDAGVPDSSWFDVGTPDTGIDSGSSDAGAPMDGGLPTDPYAHAGTCADPIPLAPIPAGRSVIGDMVSRTSTTAEVGFASAPCYPEEFPDGDLATPDVTYSLIVPAGHRVRLQLVVVSTLAADPLLDVTYFLARDCTRLLDSCLDGAGWSFMPTPFDPISYDNSTASDELLHLVVESPHAPFRIDVDLERIVGSCASPWAMCGICVDTRVDARHCGACGSPCGEREVCVASACRPSVWACPPSRTLCDDCADLMIDSRNCGACGRACGSGERCVDGDCAPDAPGESCANPEVSDPLRPDRPELAPPHRRDVSTMSADVAVLPCAGGVDFTDDRIGLTGAYRDFVYTWTAPDSREHAVGYDGSGLAFLQVFSSSACDAASRVGCGSYASHGSPGQVHFTTTAGTTYYIVLSTTTPPAEWIENVGGASTF